MTGALTRFRDGDADALDEVLDAYARPAVAVAFAVLGERGHAEQAVREAFAEAVDGVAAFDPADQSEAAWLLARVRDHANRMQRRFKPGRARVTMEPDSVWRSVMVELGAEQAHGALDALTEPQREVLDLAFWKGLRPVEIAKLRGVPEPLVRETLRAALERYRDAVARTTREHAL